MKYSIRAAQATDMPQVLELIRELAEFEKDLPAVEISAKELVRDGFGEEKRFHCFVAEVAHEIVGVALVYDRYSTWKGRIIHLEDLIISEKMRGIGLGTALLNEVVKYGRQLGVKRISWEVIDWNEPAISFYEKKGAKVLRDWDVVHLDEKGIENYLDKI